MYVGQESELVELEASVGPAWERLAQPLEKVGDRLEVSWGAVQHLKAVKDSEELRKAVEEVQVRMDTDSLLPPAVGEVLIPVSFGVYPARHCGAVSEDGSEPPAVPGLQGLEGGGQLAHAHRGAEEDSGRYGLAITIRTSLST